MSHDFSREFFAMSKAATFAAAMKFCAAAARRAPAPLARCSNQPWARP